MQVIGSATLVIFVIIHCADHLAGRQRTPAHHARGVQEPRIHVQIAEADMLAWRIDDEVKRLVARIAQH